MKNKTIENIYPCHGCTKKKCYNCDDKNCLECSDESCNGCFALSLRKEIPKGVTRFGFDQFF
jgi:hypothetical protein